VEEVAVETGEANLRLIPASIHLATAVETLYSVIFREIKLRKALDAVRDRYDYVLLDSGPNLGVLSVNALVAADRILIPTRLSMYSLDGLSALLDTIGRVKEPGADYDWRILLTMVKGYGKERQANAWNLLEPVRERILTTRIRETEAVEKSQLRDDDAPGPMAVVREKGSANRGARDYQDLVKEVLELWPA
jgi:chromosome partitioning protein